MARKFLYIVAILIVLVIAGLFALRIWSKELTEIAFVPQSEFVEQDPLADNAYQDPSMWFARPGMGNADVTRWTPPTAAATDQPAAERTLGPVADDEAETETDAPAEQTQDFAVFFVHPTSYIPVNYRDEVKWNADLDNELANDRAQLFLRGLASPFALDQAEIWAPRYRQASIGAFLTDKPEAQMALDAAYRDVEQAFDYFLATVGEDKPIVIAGHSQGALHILRLMKDRVAGTPLQARVAAIYPVGWPVSVTHDLPALGAPACASANQPGCIMSWSSFAEPAEPEQLMETYAKSIGFDGQPRGSDMIVCSNPLLGRIGGEAQASANLGTLVPNEDLSDGELVAGAVPARCDERGLLLIGDPPEMGSAVLPGNNYHVYDIPLFWSNLRTDVERRVKAWAQQP
ncbi:DUF3089 domain-containing protein [Altererythrobacter sp. CAU 1778]